MYNYYMEIAEKMWHEEGTPLVEMPQDLICILQNINDLCVKAGGQLASRQTIAVVIEQYIRDTDYDIKECV